MNIWHLLLFTASGLICLFPEALVDFGGALTFRKSPENSGPARQSSSNDMLPCWTSFEYLEIDKVLSIRKIRAWGSRRKVRLRNTAELPISASVARFFEIV